MKKQLLMTAACFIAAAMCSCTKDDVLQANNDENDEGNVGYAMSSFWDANMGVYIEAPDVLKDTIELRVDSLFNYENEEDWKQGTQTMDRMLADYPKFQHASSWENIALSISVPYDRFKANVVTISSFDLPLSLPLPPEAVELWEQRKRTYVETIGGWGKTIQDALIDYYLETGQFVSRPYLYCAGIREGARIYADKVLFGREPGENLGDKFTLLTHAGNDILVAYPSFEVVHNVKAESRTLTLNDALAKGICVSGHVPSVLNEIPEEKYDEITLTCEIPFECEYWQSRFYFCDYSDAEYESGRVIRNKDRMLKGSLLIKFDL